MDAIIVLVLSIGGLYAVAYVAGWVARKPWEDK